MIRRPRRDPRLQRRRPRVRMIGRPASAGHPGSPSVSRPPCSSSSPTPRSSCSPPTAPRCRAPAPPSRASRSWPHPASCPTRGRRPSAPGVLRERVGERHERAADLLRHLLRELLVGLRGLVEVAVRAVRPRRTERLAELDREVGDLLAAGAEAGRGGARAGRVGRGGVGRGGVGRVVSWRRSSSPSAAVVAAVSLLEPPQPAARTSAAPASSAARIVRIVPPLWTGLGSSSHRCSTDP